MKNQFHAVTLDREKCKGCVACMKRCPTEAIRVRDGKAKIHYELCVACGECVRICPYNAKKAAYDPFDSIFDSKFKYRVALPAPSFYGQFENLTNLNYLLEGLLKIGFDDVYEVARGAELVSEITRTLFEKDDIKKPIISTACPAVLRLILIRFHNLKEYLLPLITPAEASAKLAREKAVEKTGYKPEEIGVFFISPCPAKVYSLTHDSTVIDNVVDGVLSASECYFKLISPMKNVEDPRDLSNIGVFGLSWASSGGESASLLKNRYLAADGIENVVNILKELENGKLNNLDFIELNACTAGCVGGVLNIENPYVAKAKIRACRKYLPVSKNTLAQTGKNEDYFKWEIEPEAKDVLKLDCDIQTALKKIKKINKIIKLLPSLDCGSCGAPSCKSFAEDVASNEINITECHRIDLEKIINEDKE